MDSQSIKAKRSVAVLARALARAGSRACSHGLRIALLFVWLAPALALAEEPSAVTPPTPHPVVGPPNPPANIPPPPPPTTSNKAETNAHHVAALAGPVPRGTAPDGQWSYTVQYGWVFMPYAGQYTAVPASGYPYMYVYDPTFGWDWLVAPWVVGIGPQPYWGSFGPTRFAWYAHSGFANRDFRGGAGARWGGGYAHAGGHMGMGHGRR